MKQRYKILPAHSSPYLDFSGSNLKKRKEFFWKQSIRVEANSLIAMEANSRKRLVCFTWLSETPDAFIALKEAVMVI